MTASEGRERADASELGVVQWACSDERGPPDVGISVGLGDGRILWCGEITKQRHAQAGKEAAALGDDFGAWIILYDGKNSKVIGRCCNAHVGHDLVEAIGAAIRKAEAT